MKKLGAASVREAPSRRARLQMGFRFRLPKSYGPGRAIAPK